MHQIQLLKKYRIHPKKRWGQNFLIDENNVRRMVAALGAQPEDTVLEIGAGLGALTEDLAKTGARVIAIEKDAALCEILERELGGRYPNLRVVCGDVLKVNILDFRFWILDCPSPLVPLPRGEREIEERFPRPLKGGEGPRVRGRIQNPCPTAGRRAKSKIQNRKFKLIGNLPYYLTTPILLRLIDWRDEIDEALVMIQREVANRLLAQPATKDYGRLTLLFRYWAEVSLLFKVSRNCFTPKPEVDSSVVRIVFGGQRNSSPLVGEARWGGGDDSHPPLAPPMKGGEINTDLLFKLIEAAFSQRRKNLLNSLSHFYPKVERSRWQSLLEESGIDPARRAEELLLKDYIFLAQNLKSHKMSL